MYQDNDANDVDMDALFQAGVEQDEVARVERAILPASDSYRTIPPFTVDGKQFESVDDKPARKIFTAYGAAIGKKTGAEHRLRFKFSPDFQTQVNPRTGLPAYDRATKNWIALCNAYCQAYGAQKGDGLKITAAQLQEYLAAYPVDLRGSQFDGDSGPMFTIVNISAVKE